MHKFIEFFIKRSVFINLLSILVFVCGLFSLKHINREAFPNIAFDMVTVVTTYQGASSEEMETLVTIPIEDEIREVEELDEITSESREHFSLILIKIDPDADNKDKIVTDIQRAVDRSISELPDEVDTPVVTEITTKQRPVIEVSLTPKNDISLLKLQKYARSLESMLLELGDVAGIERKGWHDREFRVECSADSLNRAHVGLSDIIGAIRSKNLNLPADTVIRNGEEYIVRTLGEIGRAGELEDVVIRANDAGRIITVGDVASVRDDFEDNKILFKTAGTESINLMVKKKERGDIIRLVDQIKEVCSDFEAINGDDVAISYLDDISYYVRRRLKVLVSNGIMGFAMVIACLFLFLNFKVAFLTSLGIPFALCATFMLMPYYGYSINLLSLFGFIIVIGMMVDDAIVVAENNFRYYEQGLDPKEATVKGSAEVVIPVTATILTTISAFFPLFFVSGIFGKFVSVIPSVVIITLLASLFECFVILPCHLKDFVKPTKVKNQRHLISVFMNFLTRGYAWLLRRFIRLRYLALPLLLVMLVATVFFGFKKVGIVLFPPNAIETFEINARLRQGTPLAETNKAYAAVEQEILKLSRNELDNFVSYIGINQDAKAGTSENGSHLAYSIIYLTPPQKRSRSAAEIISTIREKVREKTDVFEEISYQRIKPGPPVGKAVEIHVKGEEFEVLERMADKMKAYLKTVPGVFDVKDSFEHGKTEIRITVDEALAARAGLSVGAVAAGLRAAFAGEIASKIKKSDEEIEIRVILEEEDRNSADILERLTIANPKGNLIPLSRLVRTGRGRGFSKITRRDHKRSVTVSADVDEKVTNSTKVNMDLMKRFKAEQELGAVLDFGGEFKDTQESIQSFYRSFLLAGLLIFLIISSTFSSVMQTLIIMMAIPFGICGVIVAFYFHNIPLSFMAILGTVGLSGIVVNDSIVLVDVINSFMREGLPVREAVMEGGKRRLRPVLLTTVTTFGGMLPTAYGWGGNDPFVRPTAIAISWGLIFATFLTLLIIPTFFLVVDDLRRGGKWIYAKVSRKK